MDIICLWPLLRPRPPTHNREPYERYCTAVSSPSRRHLRHARRGASLGSYPFAADHE